ncbi:MAG: hypothetical protein IPJ43_10065 [Saprospiraceae bacterium]|nr:hypothetical protein [Saprospiraceae bacterium]
MDYAPNQKIRTDDFNYEPLCGNFTTTGGAFQIEQWQSNGVYWQNKQNG